MTVLTNVTKPRETINILAVRVGRFGTADGSFCAWFSYEMKVLHIDLIYMYMHFNLPILIMIAFLVSTLYKRK